MCMQDIGCVGIAGIQIMYPCMDALLKDLRDADTWDSLNRFVGRRKINTAGNWTWDLNRLFVMNHSTQWNIINHTLPFITLPWFDLRSTAEMVAICKSVQVITISEQGSVAKAWKMDSYRKCMAVYFQARTLLCSILAHSYRWTLFLLLLTL